MTIRIAILGCGKISGAHALGYQQATDLAEVVVCCDEWNEQLAHDMAARFKAADVLTSWQEVIAREDVDALDICMPPYLHAPIAIAAAEAGKHVLVEKPMAMTVAQAREMAAASEANGTVLMVGQNQRFMAAHRQVKALLDEGTIGRPLAVRIDCNQFVKHMYPPGNWIFSKEKSGGGMIMQTAVHKLDLLRYFFGEVRRVSNFQANTGLNGPYDTEDLVSFLLEFESGLIGQAFYLFAAHKVPIPTATNELTIINGEKGLIHNVLGWHVYSTDVEKYSGGLTRLDMPPEPYGHSVAAEVRHFLECIQSGADPLTSGRDNLGTMAIMAALYKAAETGTVVDVQ
jgi:predicted dehydrogenase